MSLRVGDQHRPNGAPANPFEETKPRMNEFTAQEIATLQSRLDKQLGPEYISSRPGAAGQKVHYLAAEKCINLANEVFGFNGWSSAIQNIQIDFVDENQQTGKISLGLSVIVRVTLKDGSFHEDIGYGHIENCKGKAAAFEKAKKEGTTDALKRALRNFGNVLGNCIYDKDYLGKVTKIKVAPTKWDVDNLHRHADYAPVKKPVVQEDEDPILKDEQCDTSHTEVDDEFGGDVFDDADFSEGHTGHPDEVVVDITSRRGSTAGGASRAGLQNQALATSTSNHGRYPSGPQSAHRGHVQPSSPEKRPQTHPRPFQRDAYVESKLDERPRPSEASANLQLPSSPNVQLQHSVVANVGAVTPGPSKSNNSLNTIDPNGAQVAAVGFLSARAASTLNENPSSSAAAPQFNPHSESPSIRKTAGIDHNRSIPIKRKTLGEESTAVMSAGAGITNGHTALVVRDYVNPSADTARRIGVPNAAASPMSKGQGASAYRPPTRKGPDPGFPSGGIPPNQLGGRRPPLTDMTNVPSPGTSDDVAGGDMKRQRVGLNGPPTTGGAQQGAAGGR